MTRLRWLTAGESHGPGLTGIIEGVPAGLALEAPQIDAELARRQRGHGRSARQRIEQDRIEIAGGVRRGLTLGSPIALRLVNRDHGNWRDVMPVEPDGDARRRFVSVPRPGHADLAGAAKYGHADLRNVLERASARETAMRVAIGSVARRLIGELGVTVASRVTAIGAVADDSALPPKEALGELNRLADASPVRCTESAASRAMVDAIDSARRAGETLGGLFEVVATGLPVGLGSYVHWDRRLEGHLAAALMSLNAIKGVEIGLGFEAARRLGSEAHDELWWDPERGAPRHRSNRSGGIDGGVTTGEPLLLRAAMKPLATLMKPLRSVDLATGRDASAHVERSDVCAVPAAAVVAESLVALVLAEAFLDKYGGDSLRELKRHLGLEE